MREYEECYIAVLDLLGFKAALNSCSCETIASIFDEINRQYIISYDKTGEPIINKDDINFKVMSDTICVFVKVSVKNSLAALMAICDYLQIRLLRLDIPILSRGAIVKGQIYYNNDVLFGEGYVEAYCLQEKNAKYPRIIINNDVIESYKAFDEAGQRYLDSNLIKDDYDNIYTSDYLFTFYGLNHEHDSWKNFAKFVYKKVETETDERVRDKYLYLKNNFTRISQKYLDYLEDKDE